MTSQRHWTSSSKEHLHLQSKIIQMLALVIFLAEVVSVSSYYMPEGYPMRADQNIDRRQDYENEDEDEMDSNASAPYQNQNSNNNDGQSDGYEEAEPDGPYGETPREEEGQADLERFFDDHLGASEKDGMDKENLPSNIIERYIYSINERPPIVHRPLIFESLNYPIEPRMVSHPMVAQASGSIASYTRIKPPIKLPINNVEMRYLRLPNDQMIIVHDEERDNRVDQDQEGTQSSTPDSTRNQNTNVKITLVSDRMPTDESRTSDADNTRRSDTSNDQIVAAENEDMDRVYVTKAIHKPFKIDALGGYDPEQDFQDAERDIAYDPMRESAPNRSRSKYSKNNRKGSSSVAASSRDINFNDGDSDTMFNDASEKDEITFAQDEPYQTDLEAEMRSQAFDKPTPARTKDVKLENETPEVRISPRKRSIQRRFGGDDDSEGSWVNDGVDEMDIPSQDHQDKVLNKAARRQEAAAAAVAADEDTVTREKDYVDDTSSTPVATASDVQEQPASESQQSEDDQQQIDPENQRMPNANYLKNLTDEPEDYEENGSF